MRTICLHMQLEVNVVGCRKAKGGAADYTYTPGYFTTLLFYCSFILPTASDLSIPPLLYLLTGENKEIRQAAIPANKPSSVRNEV